MLGEASHHAGVWCHLSFGTAGTLCVAAGLLVVLFLTAGPKHREVSESQG